MTVTVEIHQPAKSIIPASVKREFIHTCRSFRDFALVGMASTIVHYLALTALLSGGVVQSLVAANMLGFGVALFVSYAGNRFFVFAGKHGHLSGFAALSAGAVGAALTHTALLVGLVQGQIFQFLAGPLGNLGGQLFIDFWLGFINFLPPSIARLLHGDTVLSMSTTAAFVTACSVAAIMTYCWNRFVVFHPRTPKTAQP